MMNSTSEVGLKCSSEDNAGQELAEWKQLLLQQSANFRDIIQAIKSPSTNELCFPEFNPDASGSNAKAWITMADVCIGDGKPNTAKLMIALNLALRGHALTWLTRISFPQMSWKEFKAAFIERFETAETIASFLINALEKKPDDGQSMTSWADNFFAKLANNWETANKEEIAVALTRAHLSKNDARVRWVQKQNGATALGITKSARARRADEEKGGRGRKKGSEVVERDRRE